MANSDPLAQAPAGIDVRDLRPYINQALAHCSAITKAKVSPESAGSFLFAEPDKDGKGGGFVLILTPVVAGSGEQPPSDPSKSWVRVWVAGATSGSWFEADVDSDSVLTVSPEGGFAWSKITDC